MKILLPGNGVQEDVLAWKLGREEKVKKVYALAGNPGLEKRAETLDISPGEAEELADFAGTHDVDLTLAASPGASQDGLLDLLAERDLPALGPGRRPLELEASMVQKKKFFLSNNIPAVDCGIFSRPENVEEYLREADYPLWIRRENGGSNHGKESQDGEPGGGERIFSAGHRKEALDFLERLWSGEKKGDDESRSKIIIEEIAEGERVTVFALCDGERAVPLSSARRQRHVFAGGEGPVTSGMGSFSPLPSVSLAEDRQIYEEVMLPLVEALKREGLIWRGFISVEIILSENGPLVLDFSPYFSSAAVPVVITRLEDDLASLTAVAAEGSLDRRSIDWSRDAAVCVILAAGGFPLFPHTGEPIKGIKRADERENVRIFHINTRRQEDKLLTAGGQVLAVTALDSGHFAAADRVYSAVGDIDFPNMHYRQDIGTGAVLNMDAMDATDVSGEDPLEFEGDDENHLRGPGRGRDYRSPEQ